MVFWGHFPKDETRDSVFLNKEIKLFVNFRNPINFRGRIATPTPADQFSYDAFPEIPIKTDFAHA